MKKIAIIYPEFFVGGTTTSLIFLLNSVDYSKIEIDLIVYKNRGPFKNKINQKVSVVEVGRPISKLGILIRSFFSGKLILLFFKTIFRKEFRSYFRMGISQIGAFYRAKKSLKINKKYDIAIGFMEFWANEYLLLLNATKKNMLIHPNYESASFNLFLDVKKFEAVSNISFVSLSNCCCFNNLTANKYIDKVIYFPNIIDEHTIHSFSEEDIDLCFDDDICIMATSARILFYSKGFDRVINVANELVNGCFHFKWIVIGDGKDSTKLKQELKKHKLEKYFILVGEQINPYKYLKLCHYFVLLSRREGRPMSVDESIVLGKKCIVTSYETSKEQLCNGKYGFVVSDAPFNAKDVAFLIQKDFINSKIKNRIKVQELPTLFSSNKKIIEEYFYDS